MLTWWRRRAVRPSPRNALSPLGIGHGRASGGRPLWRLSPSWLRTSVSRSRMVGRRAWRFLRWDGGRVRPRRWVVPNPVAPPGFPAIAVPSSARPRQDRPSPVRGDKDARRAGRTGRPRPAVPAVPYTRENNGGDRGNSRDTGTTQASRGQLVAPWWGTQREGTAGARRRGFLEERARRKFPCLRSRRGRIRPFLYRAARSRPPEPTARERSLTPRVTRLILGSMSPELSLSREPADCHL